MSARGVRWWGSAVLLLVIGVAPVGAQASDTVWVNTRSGVYHCRGTEYYGKTTRGEYLLESEALAAGRRPNGGRRCPPASASDREQVRAVPAQGLLGGAGSATGSVTVEPPMRPTSGLEQCRLTRIVDGDTVECEPFGAIRLIGVDTPERNQEPFYTAATAGLAAMVPLGSMLQLERDSTDRDVQGRLLRYLWSENQMLNWELVRRGWGVSLPYRTTPRYNTLFDATEAKARAEGRGLWQVNGFTCRPVDARRNRC